MTVLILVTVSDINEPINFYDLSDLLAILFTIDTLIEVDNINIGVKARVTNAICQQLYIAIIKDTTIVVEFKQTIAIMPVIML